MNKMTNEEIIKRFYIAFKENNIKECLEICDKEIEWITAEDMPEGGVFRGVKQVFENYFPKMLSHFQEFHAIPKQITSLKDHVMVNGRYQGISNIGKKFDVEFSHIYLINNNKIVQFRQFTDTKIIQESLK
jgi:ketosteroid isomerase-like protein